MFITVQYKEPAELSLGGRKPTELQDSAVEKTLLVNPDCYVRVMAEFIRQKCNLGVYADFDLCDEHGVVKDLFELPPYEYGTQLFLNRRLYYLIVLRTEKDKSITVLPQIKWNNPFYATLKEKVHRCISLGDRSSSRTKSTTKTSPTKKPGSPKTVKTLPTTKLH